jgi:hypothetical protein
VGIGGVSVDQGQLALGETRLARERGRGIQDALTPERGAERVDRNIDGVTVGGVDVENVLGRVGVPGGDGPGVDRQAHWVVPRDPVRALDVDPRKHGGEALERGDLTGAVPAARIAALGEMAGVHLGGPQAHRRGLGVERVAELRLVGHLHRRLQDRRERGPVLRDRSGVGVDDRGSPPERAEDAGERRRDPAERQPRRAARQTLERERRLLRRHRRGVAAAVDVDETGEVLDPRLAVEVPGGVGGHDGAAE